MCILIVIPYLYKYYSDFLLYFMCNILAIYVIAFGHIMRRYKYLCILKITIGVTKNTLLKIQIVKI